MTSCQCEAGRTSTCHRHLPSPWRRTTRPSSESVLHRSFLSVLVVSVFPTSSLSSDDLLRTNEQSVIFMSSTEQAASSSPICHLIVDALADYANLTGIDLSKSPSAQRMEHSNSPQAILELLEEREKAFREYRTQNQRLISHIRPAVEVLHAFSGTLGSVIDLVGNVCYGINSPS